MDHFQYRDGRLFCESLEADELATRFGTPLYVYSEQTLRDHVSRMKAAFAPWQAGIRFSVKSCPNLHILRLLGEQGLGFDVVSGGELRRVLEAGGDPSQIVFAGVGKTRDEMKSALEAGIGWFNVESEAELSAIAAVAAELRTKARVALRVNPDVDPHTHVYTTTGTRETKFGVDVERARRVFDEFGRRPSLNLCGIHLHIGSPVNDPASYGQAIDRALQLIAELRRDGHEIRALNVGGGFGAHYDGAQAPPASAYAEVIVPKLRDTRLEVLIEPGRSIAANAGVVLTRVLYRKASGDRHFVIVDAAMTDLIRPALYGAFHFAWPVRPADGTFPSARAKELQMPGTERVDIVGPVCESGDFLAKDRWLPLVRDGDLICLFTAGAYGFAMSSQYNSRPRAAEVLVQGANARLIRRRETYDDLVLAERL